MNKQFIESVLEDYLEALYRGGTEEEQDRVNRAIRELDKPQPKISGRGKPETPKPKNAFETDIINAEHPSRKKAIRIMEYIASRIGDDDIFDCKGGNTTWYDVEDILTNIIEGKE